MARELVAIDSDGHISEPVDLWDDYIDPKYRETCPKIMLQPDGAAIFRIDDRVSVTDYRTPVRPSIHTVGLFGARSGDVPSDSHYLEGEAGGFDPHARVAWLDKEGFDATTLYPTMALPAMQTIIDPDRQAAVANAYNRWLADFCKPYPDRLFGAALLPLLDVEASVREVETASALGFRAVVVRPNPVGGRTLHDHHFYPIWDACQELGMAVAVHGSGDGENLGVERFNSGGFDVVNVDDVSARKIITKSPSYAVEHAFVHTAEMMAAVTSLVMAGVCDAFPNLRLAFVEAGGTWLPGYVDRMDRHFDDVGMNDTGLKTRPSDIIRRQCFVTFEPVETSIKYLAEAFGLDKFMVASDYPHSDGFPATLAMIDSYEFRPEVKRSLLAGAFKAWYRPN